MASSNSTDDQVSDGNYSLWDDRGVTGAETSGLLYTIYINVLLCVILLAFFEANRYMKQIYLKRMTKKFERTHRVPEKPPRYVFGWIVAVLYVMERDLLHMVGLDGYMLLRFVKICLKASLFLTFWGCVVLVPSYSTASDDFIGWNKFTLANVFNGPTKSRLWIPAVFGYIFSAYFCHLLYSEYKNFVKKRVQYLVQGDTDTPPQTYYTVMLEQIPAQLRSAPALKIFFEKLFPGEVCHVEVALDLGELDSMVAERRRVRDSLEKANAYFFATRVRPTVWISQDFYRDPVNSSPTSRARVYEKSYLDYERVDSIQHYTRLLQLLNENVKVLQSSYLTQMQRTDDIESKRLRNKLDSRTGMLLEFFATNTSRGLDLVRDLWSTGAGDSSEHVTTRLLTDDRLPAMQAPPSRSSSYENAERNGDNSEVQGGGGTVVGTDIEKAQQPPRPPTNASVAINLSMNISVTAPSQHTSNISSPTVAGDGALARNRAQTASVVFSTREEGLLQERAVRFSSDPVASSNPIHNSDMRQQSRPPLGRSSSTSVYMKPGSGGMDIQASGLASSPQSTSNALRISGNGSDKETQRPPSAKTGVLEKLSGLGGLAKEGIQTARVAGKGALRGVLEATRTLEMLTLGAYYKTSSTAFVTFKSRVAACSAHQMLLSHEFYRMQVAPAPNPRDVIWDNVAIPLKQIRARMNIANATLLVGALFWSSVVGFVNRLSNLDTIAQDWPWLKGYSDSYAYKLLNQYLAVVLLLTLLSVLPVVFGFISRNYEGRKLESEIQNSIMTRYFYYQVANVFVTITVGSLDLSQQILSIITDPTALVDILGASLPGVSMYFANLIVVKILASLPLEMLRIWPLISILCVKSCMDKKKCTRRDLRTGAFSDPPILYGYIYPNLMMVLMIILTYSCIAPLLMPFGVLFFGSAYLMYKYQLLYVYVNSYQSGGFMWYAVFNRSVVSLIAASLTLVGYLGLQLKNSLFAGPFYAVIPLPGFIIYFWYFCSRKFNAPSERLSLEFAVAVDSVNITQGTVPSDTFTETLYRQPSLAEEELAPEPYRRSHMNNPLHNLHPVTSGTGSGFDSAGNRLTPKRAASSIYMYEADEDDDDEALEAHVEEVLGSDNENSQALRREHQNGFEMSHPSYGSVDLMKNSVVLSKPQNEVK